MHIHAQHFCMCMIQYVQHLLLHVRILYYAQVRSDAPPVAATAALVAWATIHATSDVLVHNA